MQARHVSRNGKPDVKRGGADESDGGQVQASCVSKDGKQDVKLGRADESDGARCRQVDL